MAYQLSIVVTNGVATVEQSLATPPPDGRFVILGDGPTGDAQTEHVMLERRDTTDAIQVQISGTHQI